METIIRFGSVVLLLFKPDPLFGMKSDLSQRYERLLEISKLFLTEDERDMHLRKFQESIIELSDDSHISDKFLETVPILRRSILSEIRGSADLLWNASVRVDRFREASMADAKRQCGSILNSARKSRLPLVSHEFQTFEIPAHFDSRKDFGETCASLIGTALDQSNCGSCWSFSTTTALEDRVCLATKGASKVHLSPLDTLSCCDSRSGCDSFGCNGGDPASAWEWFVEYGVVTGGEFGDTMTCKPYAFPQCAHHVDVPDLKPCSGDGEYETPECLKKCTNDKYDVEYGADKRKSIQAYAVAPDEKSIKIEIMKNGPVSAAFMVYEDFFLYQSGIYHHVTGTEVGGHAVKLIGWGQDEKSGEKYWILMNSWNPAWGENGSFRMKLHEGGIMNEITAGKVQQHQEEEVYIFTE
jgi:cathepsin B